MKFLIPLVTLILLSSNSFATGLNVYGLGVYDLLCDGVDDPAVDFRYEKRFENTILEIGPEEDNFFFSKTICWY